MNRLSATATGETEARGEAELRCSDVTAGTSRQVKRRKQYLYKGQPLKVPRSTRYYITKKNAQQCDAVENRSQCVPASNDCSATIDTNLEDVSPDSLTETEINGPDAERYRIDAEEFQGPEDDDEGNEEASPQAYPGSGEEYDNDIEAGEAAEISLLEQAELLANCISQFGEETLPNSSIKKAEAVALVTSFAVGHSLTWVGLGDLLKLINTLFGCEVLPRSVYMLRKLWAPKATNVKKYYYCEECSMPLEENDGMQRKCSICLTSFDLRQLKKSGNFFTVLDFSEQMKHVVQKNKKALYLNLKTMESCERDEIITDITDAALRRELQDDGTLSSMDLTITFNTDGSPVWSSSKTSVWPIQFILNELPPQVRFKNCMLIGLWFGKKHPDMTMFLDKFVDEVNETKPIIWKHDSEFVTSRVFPLCCCVDTPARAMVQNHVSFNGYFPCTWCYVPGTYIDGSMRFLNGEPEGERTQAMLVRDMEMALNLQHPINGVKGPSPLMNLPTFHLVWGQSVDYMHCILLGVTRQITESLLAVMSSADLNAVNKRLLTIQPPHCFTRLPRSLLERAYWKASEWRHWLLFYCMPSTANILPAKYWRHLCLLVEATYILLLTEITPSLLCRADNLLKAFVSRTRTLHGDSSMTYNVHQLLHVTKGVELLGPLWAHSAFVFEGGNGQLVKNITAAEGMPQQVTERVLMSQQLDILLELLPLSAGIKNQCQSMLGYEALKNFQYIGEACMLGTPKHVTHFTQVEQEAIQKETNESVTGAFEYYRFVQDSQLYHSSSYDRATKSDSSCVLTKAGDFLKIQRILRIVIRGQPKCCLLCRRIVESTTNPLHFPPHIKSCLLSQVSELVAIQPPAIASPALFVNFASETISCVYTLPNSVERD